MARNDVRCSMQHTSLFPGKNDVRATWMRNISSCKDIITISHGCLDVANTLRHRGRILICDIDSKVVESANYIREGDPRNNKPSDYPRLNLLPIVMNRDILTTILDYLVQYDVKNLGAIDIDLACTIEEAWRIAKPIFRMLPMWKYHGKVLLTYRNGRDAHGKNASEKRVRTLIRRLPKGVRYESHEKYRSDWIGRNATREIGSSMCIVTFAF